MNKATIADLHVEYEMIDTAFLKDDFLLIRMNSLQIETCC